MSIQSIIKEFYHEQNSESDVWYLAVAVVMSSVNRPEDIKHVYDVISDGIATSSAKLSEVEKNKLLASIVLRLREAILKSYVIIGFPKIINTLQELAKVTASPIKVLLPTKPIRKNESWVDEKKKRERGKKLFDVIYGKYAKAAMEYTYHSYPDLAQTTIHQVYGSTLGETSVLDNKETSLVIVSGLMIQDVPFQLLLHSLGALNNGATKQDIDRVEQVVSRLADHYKCPMAKLLSLSELPIKKALENQARL